MFQCRLDPCQVQDNTEEDKKISPSKGGHIRYPHNDASHPLPMNVVFPTSDPREATYRLSYTTRNKKFSPSKGGHIRYPHNDSSQPLPMTIVFPTSDPREEYRFSSTTRTLSLWLSFLREILPPLGLELTLSSQEEEEDSESIQNPQRVRKKSNKNKASHYCPKNPWRWFAISLWFLSATLIVAAAWLGGLGIKMMRMPRRREPTTANNMENNKTNFLVGVLYYPKMSKDLYNGQQCIRRSLSPRHLPTLRPYENSKSDRIAQHLTWSRLANIGLWIIDWSGQDTNQDRHTREIILRHSDLGDTMIALRYDAPSDWLDDDGGGLQDIGNDMEYMCENYFDNTNYFQVDDRPVIFVHGGQQQQQLEYEGKLETIVSTMRTALQWGYNLFIVGDLSLESSSENSGLFFIPPMIYFDAVTNMDIYETMMVRRDSPSVLPYAGNETIETYYRGQAEWRQHAHTNGYRFIPAVTPGYNDRRIRFEQDKPPLARTLTVNDTEGSLFAYQLSKAKELVDPNLHNLLIINSFNRWDDDTQIEPLVGVRTNEPYEMTQGVYYEGYGELYLDILRVATQPIESQIALVPIV